MRPWQWTRLLWLPRLRSSSSRLPVFTKSWRRANCSAHPPRRATDMQSISIVAPTRRIGHEEWTESCPASKVVDVVCGWRRVVNGAFGGDPHRPSASRQQPMRQLKAHTLPHLIRRLPAPTYDRSQVCTGIVHIGVGGFHRAHQAVYLDRLMNEGKALDWGISGVGLLAHDRRMHEVMIRTRLPLHVGRQTSRLSRVSWNLGGGPPLDTARGVGVGRPPKTPPRRGPP